MYTSTYKLVAYNVSFQSFYRTSTRHSVAFCSFYTREYILSRFIVLRSIISRNPCSLSLFSRALLSRSSIFPFPFLFPFGESRFQSSFSFPLYSFYFRFNLFFASISFSRFLPFFAFILFPSPLSQQFIRSKLKLKLIRTKIDRVNFTTRHSMLICNDRSVYIRMNNREVDSSVKKEVDLTVKVTSVPP